MAKSVRISDALFEQSTLESTLMHRSIAMQIEHWCALGRALEGSGLSTDELKRTLQGPRSQARGAAATGEALRAERSVPEARLWAEKRQRQRRDRAAVASGEASAESMHLIPPKLARTAIVRFRNVDFED